MKRTFETRIVDHITVRPLRWQVLRPGRPEESAHYKEDTDSRTFHVACFDACKVIGVATWYPEILDGFDAQTPFRLRGFATDPNYRRMGVGRQVMNASITLLQEKKCDFVWFFAREVAFEFYSSIGFQFHGDLFDIPMVGPHKVMYKYL